jgi:hypothetical protein
VRRAARAVLTWGMFTSLVWIAVRASADDLGNDFRLEGQNFKTSCSGFNFGAIGNCAEVLFTGDPLHIAVGSLAPGNGFGAGAALVGHWTPLNWRNSWDVDAVATENGSWRAGAYLTLVHIHRPKITVSTGPPPAPKPGEKPKPAISNLAVEEQSVFHLYAENTSLNKVTFFGIGPSTSDTARSYFGQSQAIVGGNVVFPVAKTGKLNLALLGEANGRFVDIRSSLGQSSPSIEQIYTPVTAPGLANQPGFAQFGEGLRVRPSFANDHVRLNYTATFQEYVAPSNSNFSFERFTVDLNHQFPLYQNARTLLPQDFNGPDECSQDTENHKCPPIIRPPAPGTTRNLEGSFALRMWMNQSYVPTGHVVPFYFQPTLGGSDINGNPALASYQDYRFRAPDTLLFRASFEHSISKYPIGVTAMIDEGKVGFNPGDLDFSHFIHSYSVGLTFRAGGFPVMLFLFSWGGHEGTHTSATVDTSLLGGATRPSLY